VAAALGVTVLGGIVWLAPEAFVERVTRGRLASDDPQVETFFASRGWMWYDAYEVFRAHPVIGAGLGTFATVYPIYSLSNGNLAPRQAHNDYLQLLAESGLVGGALAVWFMALVLRAAWRGAAAREPWRAGVALGGGAALAGLMVHSVFDFNLQLPANALLFLTLAAVVSCCGEGSQAAKRVETQSELVTAGCGSRLRYEV
jgi:O-antigen ligase